MKQKNILIIGNGISGVTAARYIRKLSDHRITIISSETAHFFSRTALMYIYMGHVRFEDTKPYEDWFWKKNRIDLIQDRVLSINTTKKEIHLTDKGTMSYDDLILATGSSPNKFGWPGQDSKGVQGLYSYQDLESMEAYSADTKHAVIVGGGLIGIEMAEMFLTRGIKVTFLVREKSYWNAILPNEESKMINNHIFEHHVDLRLATELTSIHADGSGRVSHIIASDGDRIDCQFVGLTAGVHPNITFIKESENCDIDYQRGILVNQFLETTAPSVYAIGDCAQLIAPNPGRRPIEAIWYTGRMMGETVAYTICGKEMKYNPGLWFNSAKFFDIEYQVYGDVRVPQPEEHDSIFWQSKDKKKAIRIVFEKETQIVVGFNLMGVRYRHEVCEKWILDHTSIDKVMSHLSLANFDPEFYREYESEILEIYNIRFDKQIRAKSSRTLDKVLSFLSQKR